MCIKSKSGGNVRDERQRERELISQSISEHEQDERNKIDWHNFIDLISPCFMRCRCIIGKDSFIFIFIGKLIRIDVYKIN